MDDIINYMGKWWIPENPEAKMKGRIFTEGDRIRLKLGGRFRQEYENFICFQPNDSVQTINGITSDGKALTLIGCFPLEMQFSQNRDTGQFCEIQFQIDSLFIGFHFSSLNCISINSIRISYSNLSEFADLQSFRIKNSSDFQGYVIRYKKPAEKLTFTYNDIEIGLVLSHNIPITPFGKQQLSLKQEAFFQISNTRNMNWNDILEVIHRINMFFSFVMRTDINTEEIGLTVNTDDSSKYLEYLDHRILQSKHDLTKNSQDMIFSLFTLNGRFCDVLKKWLTLCETMKPVIDRYYLEIKRETHYNIFSENDFLNVITALEAFHRFTMDNYDTTKDEHSTRLNDIIGNTPPEYRKWLQSKLQYSNEKSLRSRLRDIEDIINSEEYHVDYNKNTICNIVKQRNYFVHYSNKYSRKDIDYNLLLDCYDVVRSVLLILILRELGINEKRINEVLDGTLNH